MLEHDCLLGLAVTTAAINLAQNPDALGEIPAESYFEKQLLFSLALIATRTAKST